MGTYQSGAFGSFSGKVGDVIGTKWKGVDVVRNYPRKSNKPPGILELQHRDKFSFVMRFIGLAMDLVKVGYGGVSRSVNAENMAFKHNYNAAVKGIHPDFELDCDQISLSNWLKMDRVMRPGIQAFAEQSVKVTWVMDEFANQYTSATDKAYVLLYDPLKYRAVKSCGEVSREALEVEIFAPDSFVGDVVQCWIFFASENGKLVSETSYVGEVRVEE